MLRRDALPWPLGGDSGRRAAPRSESFDAAAEAIGHRAVSFGSLAGRAFGAALRFPGTDAGPS
eukprot:10212448-Alexandrium_andersonii.AAC.1